MVLPLFPSSTACLSQGRQFFSEAKRAVRAGVPWPSGLVSWADQDLGNCSYLSSDKEPGSIWTGDVPSQSLHMAAAPAWWLSRPWHFTLLQNRQEQREKHHLWTAARWRCRTWCHHPGFESSPRAQDPGPKPTPKPTSELLQEGSGGMMPLCHALTRLKEGLGGCPVLPAVTDTNRELTHGPTALLAPQTGQNPHSGAPCCPTQHHRQDTVPVAGLPCAATAPPGLATASPQWTGSIHQLPMASHSPILNLSPGTSESAAWQNNREQLKIRAVPQHVLKKSLFSLREKYALCDMLPKCQHVRALLWKTRSWFSF